MSTGFSTGDKQEGPNDKNTRASLKSLHEALGETEKQTWEAPIVTTQTLCNSIKFCIKRNVF